MDPLSIAASITGIVSACLRAATGLDAVRIKFKYAHLTITALVSQCRAINAGLSRLESLLRESRTIRDRPDLMSTFDLTLSGCHAVLFCLESTIDKLRAADVAPGRSRIRKWRNRASIVWNEDEMKRYFVLLQGQQSAVSFLIQLLQM